MRVLFLATYFPKPQRTTMGVWALEQGQAFLRAGLEVRVVSLTSWVPRLLSGLGKASAWTDCPARCRWGDLEAFYPRWLVYQFGWPKRWAHRHPGPAMCVGWATGRRFLERFIEEWGPDLVYAHHTAASGAMAWRLHRRCGLPYVITDHDFEEITDCVRYPGRRKLFEQVTSEAGRMVAVSRRMEGEMVRLFPGIRVARVANGSDPIPPAILQRARPPELQGKRIVCSVGMFYPRKGFPLLVRAFAPIARSQPDVELRIVGDGEDRPNIRRAIAECGLEGRVHLLGTLPHEAALQEIAWCDAFALVGWDEPHGVVFNEAMSAAKPIICAGDGGINDYFRSGEHGLAVPPRDEAAARKALQTLLADEKLRSACGRAGRKLYEAELNWDVHAQRMRAIFDEVLAESGQSQNRV